MDKQFSWQNKKVSNILTLLEKYLNEETVNLNKIKDLKQFVQFIRITCLIQLIEQLIELRKHGLKYWPRNNWIKNRKQDYYNMNLRKCKKFWKENNNKEDY
jgi:hypothetical protein